MSPLVLPKILLLGAGGQLGKELFLYLDEIFNVTSCDYRLLQEGSDLCEPEQIAATVNTVPGELNTNNMKVNISLH